MKNGIDPNTHFSTDVTIAREDYEDLVIRNSELELIFQMRQNPKSRYSVDDYIDALMAKYGFVFIEDNNNA